VAKKVKKKKARELAQKKKLRKLKKLRAELSAVRDKLASIKRRAGLIDSAVRSVGRQYLAPEGTKNDELETALEYFRAD